MCDYQNEQDDEALIDLIKDRREKIITPEQQARIDDIQDDMNAEFWED